MSFFKEQHDKLLLDIPEGVSHDAASCNFCTPNANQVGHDISTEGGDMTTYNDEDFTAAVQVATATAVANATAPLQAEIDRLKADQATSEIDSKIAEAKAEVQAELEKVQAELDSAMVKATNAETERDNIVAYLTEEAQRIEAATLRESKRDERRAAVQEASNLPDEYIDANIDRWVAMADEDFEAAVADWKNVPKAKADDKKKESGDLSQSKDTAMDGTRNENGTTSDAKSVFQAIVAGVDVRKLI